MAIKVIIGQLDVTELVQSATTSGNATTFDRKLNLKITGTIDGRKRALNVEEGARVLYYVDDVLDFVGVLFAQDIESYGDMNLIAYDTNIYLAKSNDSFIIKNKKASDVIKQIARDYGIEIGQIDDTGYVIPYYKAEGTLREIILKVLNLTKRQTGLSYFIGNDKGKLTLKKGAKPSERYVLSAGENLLSATYHRTIDGTKTQIKVIGGTKGKETVITVKDSDKRVKYGVLQEVEIMDESATPSQVKQRAETLIKQKARLEETLDVEVLGVREVKTGTAVRFFDEMTGAPGDYYVAADTHEYKAGLHTMSLSLERTYELEYIET